MTSPSTPLFNTGNDMRAVFMGAYGRINFSHITGFRSRPRIKKINVSPNGRPPLEMHQPAGWDFDFTVERKDAVPDNYQALKETNFWIGLQIPVETVYVYIKELDGSTTVYTFIEAVSSLMDAGNWEQEHSVKMTITGFAGRRIVGK